MTTRFPLLARILLWLFLNLVLLGLAFGLLFHFQLRLGLDSLLAGRAGERGAQPFFHQRFLDAFEPFGAFGALPGGTE